MTSAPIEELLVPFDATPALEKVQRRRRAMRSRLVSLGITVLVLVAIYIWKHDQLSGASFIALYAFVLALSLCWFLGYLIAYLRAKRELASVGTGTALRIGRPGVEIRGVFVPWTEVRSLAAVKPGIGRAPQFQLTRADGPPISVPFDQIPVRPATLDMTARAYSAGRFGVGLEALEA